MAATKALRPRALVEWQSQWRPGLKPILFLRRCFPHECGGPHLQARTKEKGGAKPTPSLAQFFFQAREKTDHLRGSAQVIACVRGAAVTDSNCDLAC